MGDRLHPVMLNHKPLFAMISTIEVHDEGNRQKDQKNGIRIPPVPRDPGDTWKEEIHEPLKYIGEKDGGEKTQIVHHEKDNVKRTSVLNVPQDTT
jgi:hypothetical protein